MAERQCQNCGCIYDPADTSDPLWGLGVTQRYCGPCGLAEAHLLAAGTTGDAA